MADDEPKKVVHELQAKGFDLPSYGTHETHHLQMTRAQFDKITEELKRVFSGSEEQTRIWLLSRHPLLGNQRPIDCKFEDVQREVDRLVNR